MVIENANAPSEQNDAAVNDPGSEEKHHAPGRLFSRETFRKRKRVILGMLIILLSVGGIFYWWRSTYWENTDDAQIDGHINPVSARVKGHVVHLDFRDYQYVEAGTRLVEIDPADYLVAVERARAEYADARAGAQAARAIVPITVVNTRSGIVSAAAHVANAGAGVAAAEKQLEAARARLRENEAANVMAQANLTRYGPLVTRPVNAGTGRAGIGPDRTAAGFCDPVAGRQRPCRGKKVQGGT